MSTVKRFGRYEVVRQLGQGGMGAVFLARDESLGREVAVKTLHPFALAGAFAGMVRDRFNNEARAVASLAHPNIVQVFDIGVEGDIPYLVMEVVRGRSLGEQIQERRLSVDEARVVGVQIAQALAAAHAASILHRDVKPNNVLEAASGIWKLADFGVAKRQDAKLTLTGQFLGTMTYAAPESVVGGEFSPTSDVYSLGRTLYEALTGAHPFGAAEAGVVASAKNMPPRPIRDLRPDVPAELERAILDALAHDPGRRPSATAFAQALVQASPANAVAMAIVPPSPSSEVGPPRRGRRWLPVAVVVGGIAVLAIVIGLATRGADAPSSPEARLVGIEQRVNSGDLDGAIAELTRLVEEDPTNEPAREWLARLRFAVGAKVTAAE